MLKLQIALIAILIACVAFVSCDRGRKILEPVADEIVATDEVMPADDMTMDMMKMLDPTTYMSWAHVMLPAPVPQAEATSPKETGEVHGKGTRTVYINDIGAPANKAGTAYPPGTMIIKTIMDDTNTFVAKKALMMKSDDPMYTDHNGWRYEKYARSSADAKYMQVRGSNLADAGMGCHGCHAKADNDSVFVLLAMDTMPKDDMDKDMTGEDMDKDMPEGDMHKDMDEDMPEDAATSDPGSGHDDGHGDGHGDAGDGDIGNGAGNGDTGGDDGDDGDDTGNGAGDDEGAITIANDEVQ